MRGHLTYRSGNPVLNKNTFASSHLKSDKMTINGTVNKTFISLIILMASGYYCFSSINPVIIIGLGIGGFIIALVTIFKKEWSPVTVPIYSVLEGLALGGISAMYASLYDGIVIQAIGLTVSILFALLFAYRAKMIVVTQKFRSMIITATFGIFLFYIINLIISLFVFTYNSASFRKIVDFK